MVIVSDHMDIQVQTLSFEYDPSVSLKNKITYTHCGKLSGSSL
jgi:hypothetical protein